MHGYAHMYIHTSTHENSSTISNNINFMIINHKHINTMFLRPWMSTMRSTTIPRCQMEVKYENIWRQSLHCVMMFMLHKYVAAIIALCNNV